MIRLSLSFSLSLSPSFFSHTRVLLLSNAIVDAGFGYTYSRQDDEDDDAYNNLRSASSLFRSCAHIHTHAHTVDSMHSFTPQVKGEKRGEKGRTFATKAISFMYILSFSPRSILRFSNFLSFE